jgi:branched-chain amino acid aminotransferase, group II
MYDIRVEKTTLPKQHPDEAALGFGKYFSDHMLAIDYNGNKGWHDARIVPYSPISLDPATTSLHYGQMIFEGMKAYRTKEGKVVMFRPKENMKRMNISAERLCMAQFDVDEQLDAIAKLVRIEENWIPSAPGTSLYVRPFMIATDPFLGIHPSDQYLFLTILSPVGAYYAGGLAPVRIYVEPEYVRAVRGGTGFAKCAGNYAGSLLSQMKAHEQGYSQVLWLDGVERKYIEEVGAMNIFFVIDDEIVTPELNGSILPGVTRDSVMDLLRAWGMKVSERHISIDDLAEAYKSGSLKEVFGTGTAAVISPVGELKYGDLVMNINNGEIGALSQKIYDELTGIQKGERPDPFGWVYEVK